MIYDIYLAARNSSRLNDFSKDITVRTNKIIKTIDLDILDYPSHQGFYDNLDEKPFGVICAVGYMGEQSISQTSFDEAHQIIDTNFTGVVSLLNIITNDFEKRKSGFNRISFWIKESTV